MAALTSDVTDGPTALDTRADSVLGLVLEATNTGLWTWDVASDRVRWSKEAYAIHGIPPGEFVGTGAAFFRLVHPADRARVEDSVRSAIRERRAYSETFRIVRPDGSVRRVTNSGRASYDADGACAVVLGTITDVTDHDRRADLNEQRFRAVLESSVDGFMMFESVREHGAIVDFRWTYANDAASRLVNAPPGGFVGRRLLDVHPGNRDEGLFDGYVRVVETGEPFTREFLYRRDGLDLELRLVAVRVGDGFGVTFQDRERHRISRELQRSQRRLALALRVGRIGAWEYDVRADRFEYDASLLEVFGLRPEEADRLSTGWAELIHPDDLPALLRARAEAFAAGTTLDVSYRIRHPGGELRWVTARGEPEFDARGAVVRMVGVTQDVTERREAERALELANARLQQAAGAAELGIHEYRPDTGELFWDARLRSWWGLDGDEPVTYEKFVERVHPDDRAAMQAAVERSLDPGGDGRFDAEYRVTHPDGTQRWMHATGQVAFADGRPLRLVGTVQDVTAVHTLTERLRLADRRKDEFLATLSHELRNPLAPIRSAAQILGSPKLSTEQTIEARAIIQRQVRHMAWLLDDLLDLARITQGKLDLKRARTSLAAVVDAAIEAARPAISARNHELIVALPSETIALDVDAVRVSQVLSNLLTNAAKYTDPGGRIELTARAEGAELLVTVRDDGIGLTPESLARIFDMFSQVEAARERADGGLGIGLALVAGLVELHGGEVDARSDGPGRGSEFRVRLPVVVAVEPALNARVNSGTRAGSPGRRVLVVDDNHDAACSLGMVLELEGHEVRVAIGGRDALSLAQAFRPEVALVDIGMPDLDGHAVARSLRAEPWGAAIELIALTGWGQDEDKRRAYDAGFDRHMTKPVDLDELARTLQRAR